MVSSIWHYLCWHFLNQLLLLKKKFVVFKTCHQHNPTNQRLFQYYSEEFTIWDRFEIDGIKEAKKNPDEMTLGEFIKYFKEKHNLEVTMVSQGVAMIYSFFMSEAKRKERFELK